MEGLARVHAAAQDRNEAFMDVVAPHYGGLVRRLTIVVGDHEAARDLAQEAYMRAYKAWDRFDGRDPRAWLHTIGLRLAFNERARRRRLADILQRHPQPMVWIDRSDLELSEAVRGLRPQHRAALLLSAVDGYTQAEIARMLEVPPGTVASWLARAKAHLREVLTHG